MQATLTKSQNVFTVDVANDVRTFNHTDESNELVISVPNHMQPALDSVLDYYADNGQKPSIKLCGNPLDIVSDFITQIETTLPQHLLNSGRDIIDFIINNLCEFSREKSVNHMTFNFTFQRKQEV